MPKNYIKYILVFAILLGVIFRLIPLGGYIFEDEASIMIAGIKFFHQSYADGASYAKEHPPLARFFIGLPSAFIPSQNYKDLSSAEPGYYWFQYNSFKPLADAFFGIRLFTALAGILTIAFVYLIGKKLFNPMAGLWSAALVSLSSDFIFYSSRAFTEGFMLLFAAGAIYFYLRFIDAKNKTEKIFSAGILFLFLLLEIGSRPFNTLFLPLALPIAFYLHKRKFNRDFFSLLAIAAVAVALIYFFVWPPEFQKHLLELKSSESIFGFSFLEMIGGIFLRNSYLFAFSAILAIAYIFREKKHFQIFQSGKNIIPIFFLISFIGLGFTSLASGGSQFMRFISVLFLPLAIAGGFAISKFSESKIFFFLALVLAAASAFFILGFLPNHLQDYSNFSMESFRLFPSDEIEKTEKELKLLDEIGSPKVLTNEPNILIFYKGNEVKKTPHSTIADCTQKNLKEILQKNFTIIHRFVEKGVDSFRDEMNLCVLLNPLRVREIGKIGSDSVLAVEDVYNETELEPVREFLEKSGNPAVLTNSNSFLAYYIDSNGQSPVPAAYSTDSWCAENYKKILQTAKPIFVFDARSGKSISDFCYSEEFNFSKTDSLGLFEIYSLS